MDATRRLATWTGLLLTLAAAASAAPVDGTGATYGVYGQCTATTAYGYLGYTRFGVYAWTPTTDGVALYGIASSATGTTRGIYGRTASNAGTAVYAVATSTTGATRGVDAQCASESAIGVYGYAYSATGSTKGVYGRVASTSGTAVYAQATAATGTTYGVYGKVNSGDGWAGYFEGGNGLYTSGFKMPFGHAAGRVLTSDANGVGTWQAAPGSSCWSLTGDAGTTPGTNFLGTTDHQALQFHVHGKRAFRIEPHSWVPNLIGGSGGNTVTADATGAVIAGGGDGSHPNQVTDNYGVVGGGNQNQAGDGAGTVTDAANATVAGGHENTASATCAAICGGSENVAAGSCSAVGGGFQNTATAYGATVGGGDGNTASDSRATVAGGGFNSASGQFATVPGGMFNSAAGDYSLAAGRRAQADHQGSFVWADSTDADFASGAVNQFLIRAGGGVGIGTDSPATALDVNGTVSMTGFKMSTGATNGYVLKCDATGVGTWQAEAGGGGSGWALAGNAGTTPGTNFLGTTDNQALEVKVNNTRALRVEPHATSPNIIGGYSGNTITAGVYGAVIGGGGQIAKANRVTDHHGVVGGGYDNQAGDGAGTVDDALYTTVGGGSNNTAGGHCGTVGGGANNAASGWCGTVCGGADNTASDWFATVGGGVFNTASADYATVAGGTENTASGDYASVPGGLDNTAAGTYSFAAGRHAGANHQGAFVWADSTAANFDSSGANQFLIRASGGVGIGKNDPASQLDVNGTVTCTGFKMATGAGAGKVLTSDATGVGTWQAAGAGSGWALTGNASTTPGTNFLGTTDNQALQFHVNGTRAVRIEPHATSPNLIGGYSANAVTAGVYGAVISGGGKFSDANQVTDHLGVVGGGYNNRAGDGAGTADDASSATVGGGSSNAASGPFATVAGGLSNSASGAATVGGGSHNTASGVCSTVAGGNANTASGLGAAVAGGGDWSHGNSAGGDYSAVPGGIDNSAAGDYSFAAGRRAKANHNGAFVWADSTNADLGSSAANRFMVRASGGVYFYTDATTSAGAYLGPNQGTWANLSDREMKKGFAPVSPKTVLEKLLTVPITTWSYKPDSANVPHMGAMAQDLHAAFGLGGSDRSICTIDADGISMAAIQGLYQVVQEKDAEIRQLKDDAASKNSRITELEQRLSAIEAALDALGNE